MKLKILGKLIGLAVMLTLFVACQENEYIEFDTENSVSFEKSTISAKSDNGKGFVHGIVIDIDGEDYYFAGPPDGPNGATDVPGHYWRQAGKNQFSGKHYNIGPFGMGTFWSSTSELGEYLYTVHGIIDIWTEELSLEYAAKGYVHRHEFVSISDGEPHPSKVIWLKHIAVTNFLFDGPMAPNAMHEHEVSPGIDWEFPNNYMIPYPEE